MYRLLHYIHTEQPELVGGFIHVPYAAQQTVNMANTPSMSLSMISDALRLAAEAAVENKEDISAAHGETH